MRATLIIPDSLMEKVQTLSGEKSKTRAIVAAMKTFVKLRGQEELRALRGKVRIDYEWECEEAEELKLQEKRGRILDTEG